MALFICVTIHAVQAQTNGGGWAVLGPVPVFPGEPESENESAQKEAFDREDFDVASLKVAVGQEIIIQSNSYQWQNTKASEGIVTFDDIYKDKDFVYAYAHMEIDRGESGEVLFGVGSDDAVKVWLNGKLIHEKWVARSFTIDEDLIPVTLRKGKNQILLKVQDQSFDWKFSCRVLTPEMFSNQLETKSAVGDLDAVKQLITFGADVNAKGASGLTALQSAKIKGRTDIIELLLEKGADSDVAFPPTASLINQMFNRQIEDDGPGASVLVARGNEVIYQNVFGHRNIKKDQPITLASEFRIGSITKQFTAAAILRLQEEGKLSVKDPVSKFISDIPNGDVITIHQLLTHISGIQSYTNQPDFIEKVTTEIQPEELVKKISTYKTEFEPGTSWNYNNSAYFMLGYIISKVSGASYGDYLKREFFEPLGMKHTGVYTKKAKLKEEALGYSSAAGDFEMATDWDMSWAGGAGNLYSTPEDLLLWNQAVFNGDLLEPASLEAALTPVKLSDGSDPSPLGMNGYGYGWAINEFRGLNEYSHGGGLHGFLTYLAHFPESDLNVVVLTNCSPGQFNPSGWARQISELYLWEDMEAQKSFAINNDVDAKSYRDFVGRYEYPGGAVMVVTEESGQLYAQLTGQQKFEIFPSEKDVFFWKVVDAQISFERDASGQVISGLHQQGGGQLKVPRIADIESINIDPAILAQYSGTYEMNPSFSIEITTEADRIYAQATNQPKFELFPVSNTEFQLKEVVAKVAFVKDDKGQVEHLILHQANMEQKAMKVK